MGIHIKMINAPGIESAGAAHQPMDFIALLQQKLRQIAAILTGNAGD